MAPILLKVLHWRHVALILGLVPIIGAMIMFFSVEDTAAMEKSHLRTGSVKNALTTSNNKHPKLKSISRIFSNRMFWLIGLAHSTHFLARGADKLLGSFIYEAAKIEAHLCGFLTLSVTFGLVIGLITGKKMNTLSTIKEKQRFVSKRYLSAVLSAGCLSLCANRSFGALIGSNLHVLTITLASCLMASSISFQFYQFPAAFSSKF